MGQSLRFGKRVAVVLGLALVLAAAAFFFLPRYSVMKAKEAVLREDLWIFRDSINQFFEKHGEYPESLQNLVDEGYIRVIPVDPITNSDRTWITKLAEPDKSDPDTPAGIRDVRSGAPGTTVEGVPYAEL